MDFPITLDANPGGELTVMFPDLPEAITEGRDESEALEMAAECLAFAITLRLKERKPIPVPSAPEAGQRTVALPARLAAKAAVWQLMTDQGLSMADLAARLGWQHLQVRRVLEPGYQTKVDTLDQVFRALGRRLVLTAVAA